MGEGETISDTVCESETVKIYKNVGREGGG